MGIKAALSGTVTGSNRTGISRAPELAEAMQEATREFKPSSRGDATALAEARAEKARRAEPIGTMPPPSSVGQLAKTALRVVGGGQPALLLDKLAERLAFERSGTRLYEALISKRDAGRTFRGGPSRDDLEHIRDEEHKHAQMLEQAIVSLNGDPTVVTPSANVHATASKGLCAVLTDPRTDVQQCLEAMLVAELVDNDCWPALIELAEQAGETELVTALSCAVEDEREHLAKVRDWIAIAMSRSRERAQTDGARPRPSPSNGPGEEESSRSAAKRTSRTEIQKRSPATKRATVRAKAKRQTKTPRAKRH